MPAPVWSIEEAGDPFADHKRAADPKYPPPGYVIFVAVVPQASQLRY